VVLTIVAALFVAAMALGSSSVPLLLVAAALLVGAGLVVFLLGLRHNEHRGLQGTGYVISVQRPPVDNIQGRCDMRLRVNLPGRPAVDMKVRAPAVPVTRWPVAGQTLPIEAAPNNPRQVRVRWDLVELGYIRAPDPTPPRPIYPRTDPTPIARQQTFVDPAIADPPMATVHVYTDYAERALDDDYAPPVRPRLNLPALPAAPESIDPPVGLPLDPPLDPDYDDSLDGPTVATPAPAPSPSPSPDAASDIATSDIADETLRVEETSDEPPVEPDAIEELPRRLADSMRSIPSPRPGDEPPVRFMPGARVDGEVPAMGGMLIVADLDRSLRFYSEVLGFTVVYAASGNAVVEYGGGRILLQHMADFSPIDRRVGHLHIEVPDLDLAFADLVAKGVRFSHRPRMVSRGKDMELWKATFRDPDGHGIALTEWRPRESP
jgi:catechol 2,3-dioxygenase-like lactoylglutathione lyase family enzyme